MNASMGELEAERTAAQVLREMRCSEPPVCPFAIAESKGIIVRPKPADREGVSGFLMRVGDEFGICHATHITNEAFIRFTVAHELGHYFLEGHADHLFPNGNGVHRSRTAFVSTDRYERQADQFATALLMPSAMFRAELRKAGEGFRAIESLSRVFQTSLTATAIRFTKFVDDPVAVIVSFDNKVEYCFMSSALADLPRLGWIKKGDVVPPSTFTHSFNSDLNNIDKSKRKEGYCFLDDWIEDAPKIEMNEDVVGLGSYGKTLTVLHTSEAIDLDEEENDNDDDGPRWAAR